jgi:hypothetical protein
VALGFYQSSFEELVVKMFGTGHQWSLQDNYQKLPSLRIRYKPNKILLKEEYLFQNKIQFQKENK